MAGLLIVSPHLDDGLLSCWHAMAGAPERVTVATLFAGLPPPEAELSPWDRACGGADPVAHTLLRRLEDEAALTKCGVRFVHCDFLPLRYRTEDSREPLVERLEELAEHSDEMWLPAGIGGHPDHVLAAEAALSASVRCRRVLYADLPYATREQTVVPPTRSMSGRMALHAKVVAALSPPGTPGRPPVSYRLSRPEEETKRRCLEEYESQLPSLRAGFPGWWEDPEVFGWEWWWPLDGNSSSEPLPGLGAPSGSTDRQPGAPPDIGVLIRLRGGWRARLWPLWRRREWNRIPRGAQTRRQR